MGRMSELAADIAIADQLREERPTSVAGLLMQIGFMAADLRRLVLSNPGCLSYSQETQLQTIRMDLESVARIGGSIPAFIEGTEQAPMPSLQAAE